MKAILGIPFLNRIDLLRRAVVSVDGVFDSIYIVDNSCDSEAGSLAAEFGLKHLAFFGVSLNFSQSMNLLQKIAFRENADVLFTMHNDAEAPEGASRAFLDFVTNKFVSDSGWGCVFTNYDTLVAFRMEAVRLVGSWDTNLPQYFADNDYYRRVELTGFRNLETGIPIIHHNEGSSTIKSSAVLRAQNGITFPLYERYYERKWGGKPGSERFATPFNGA